MKVTVDGKVIKMEMELSGGVVSKSGKSKIVYTTGGFVPVEGTDLRVSINIIKPK